MNWYKKAQNDISYIGDHNFSGALFVHFRIDDKYWIYRLAFPELVEKTKYKAMHISGANALDFAKNNNKDAFKVSKDWPSDGRIEREEFTKDELEERRKERNKKSQTPVQQKLNLPV